jgi:dihydroorotate dehydrogenase electron transfer subunit
MKKYQLNLSVVSNEMIGSNVFLLILSCDNPLPDMIAGQFAELLVDKSKVLLRRPISIHSIDRINNQIQFLIQIVGEGTRALAALKPLDIINVVFPLGNGFGYRGSHFNSPLLIGGGVGIAPLLFLGQELSDIGIKPTFLFGGRNVDSILRLEEFRKYGSVHITTEDGSLGEKGFVTNHSLLLDSCNFDMIFACGPTPMLKAVGKWAIEHDMPCEVSLEHKMACGIGACLCCVESTDNGNVCVCKEGPVFLIDKLSWFR